MGDPAPSVPVFVDGSGRRRKNWRRLTIAVVAALCGYVCLLAVGFAGGPIPPAALLPIPGVPGNSAAPSTAPGNAPTGAPKTPAAHVATSESAKDTGRLPSRAGAEGPTRITATKPAVPQPSTTASGIVVPPAPSGTTVLTPSSTVSSTTHGPQGTPPGHSHTKSP